jgi:AcrR family transcriptional regulator
MVGTARVAKTRRRRTAEEARREILDVAEARFLAGGPAALRLQEIAAEVGVSHPTILHHFGSREGLVRAVATRGLESLQAEVMAVLSERDVQRIDVPALVQRVFATLGERGQARMLAWLALSEGPDGGALSGPPTPLLRGLSDIVHARRKEVWSGSEPCPTEEDTRFSMMLIAMALLSDALLGDGLRASSGFGHDPAAAGRFHVWLAELLVRHLGGRPPP